MDFQNDKSNIASRQFMEMQEFRSMITSLRRRRKIPGGSSSPPQRSKTRSARSPTTARFAEVAGVGVG
jgi:hypothetical protein